MHYSGHLFGRIIPQTRRSEKNIRPGRQVYIWRSSVTTRSHRRKIGAEPGIDRGRYRGDVAPDRDERQLPLSSHRSPVIVERQSIEVRVRDRSRSGIGASEQVAVYILLGGVRAGPVGHEPGIKSAGDRSSRRVGGVVYSRIAIIVGKLRINICAPGPIRISEGGAISGRIVARPCRKMCRVLSVVPRDRRRISPCVNVDRGTAIYAGEPISRRE
jgi:hypothetical protein